MHIYVKQFFIKNILEILISNVKSWLFSKKYLNEKIRKSAIFQRDSSVDFYVKLLNISYPNP